MSWPYLRAVLEMDPPQWDTPAEFAVLVTLANHARDGGVAYPSKPTIARRIGLQRRQVWNVTRQLAQRGLIFIEEGAGPRGVDKYTLLFEPITTRPKVATGCQGDTPSTLATGCQSGGNGSGTTKVSTEIWGDPGNDSAATLAMTTGDPGNGLPQPWQSAATNPVEPLKTGVRGTASATRRALEDLRQQIHATAKSFLLKPSPFAGRRHSVDDVVRHVRTRFSDLVAEISDAELEAMIAIAYAGYVTGSLR